MEPIVSNKKLEPGTYQGIPEAVQIKNEDASSPRFIRTMKSDTAEVIKEKNETLVSIALAEEKKLEKARLGALATQQAQIENAAPAPKRIGRVVIVLVFICIILIGVLAYMFILPRLGVVQIPRVSLPSFEKPSNTAPVPATPIAEPLASSIIPAQSEKRFDISKETVSKVVAVIIEERGKGSPAGSIKNLYFTDGQTGISIPITSDRLLAFIGAQSPNTLTRSLEKEFMAGFFGEKNGGATPFLILKVSDRDTGFAGMLEWEPTLSGFFNTIFGTNIDGASNRNFNDIIILGKDARVIDNTFGGTIAYAFANQNTIVITGSLTALVELLPLAVRN